VNNFSSSALFLEKSAKKSGCVIPFENGYVALREEFETPPTSRSQTTEFLYSSRNSRSNKRNSKAEVEHKVFGLLRYKKDNGKDIGYLQDFHASFHDLIIFFNSCLPAFIC